MQDGAYNNDGWRDLKDMPEDLHVLFIEGYCQVPWMQNKYQKYKSVHSKENPFAYAHPFRVWCTDPSYLSHEDISPDAFGVERCQQEIESGRYHAIIVIDYSNPDARDQFEKDFGSLLQAFAAAGGVVAFPSSEGLIVSTLKKLFDVEWKLGNYYRTTWGPCLNVNERNIHFSFGNGNYARRIIMEYSAKAVTMKSVPYHERCFGVTDHSKTQSLVPFKDGQDVSAKPEDPNYETVVAMHEYGKGVIAYFGDVNAEDQTIELVAAFVESRSPRLPIDCFSRLDQSAFTAILALKEEGNTYFKDGIIDKAIASYKRALEKFGHKDGSHGPQRDCQVALWSNLTLMYMKKQDFHQAESCSTKALDLEWDHAKCSYNLAKTRLNISRKTRGGDMVRLRKAKHNLLNADPGDATRKLMYSITDEIDKLEKKEQQRFSSGFASGFASALSE